MFSQFGIFPDDGFVKIDKVWDFWDPWQRSKALQDAGIPADPDGAFLRRGWGRLPIMVRQILKRTCGTYDPDLIHLGIV